MGTIIGWLVARGLSQRLARGLATAGLFLALLALGAAVWTLWLHFHDKGVIARHEAEADRRAVKARERSEREREADAARLGRQEENDHAIIDDAAKAGGDDRPGAAAVALGCERLRRANVRPLPSACGPGGGDRGEAGSRP